MKQLWDRWAPLAGVLSVVCSLVGVLFVLGQPQEKDSNAKIDPPMPRAEAHRRRRPSQDRL